ncbi:MAG: hypothetical protein ACI9BW_004453 [Gammaproteobacteria bacterium]
MADVFVDGLNPEQLGFDGALPAARVDLDIMLPYCWSFTSPVISTESSRAALHTMSEQARDSIGETDLIAIADGGYYSGKEIVTCKAGSIQTLLPKPHTSGNRSKGRFEKQDFRYLQSSG